MSIIRVDKSAGRWEAVPVALTNDVRLSLETRGLAAWFMTRPSNWRIQAGALSGLLSVGRDKVKRMLRELEVAGYLVRSRSHDAEGRWVWESTFSPVPAIDVFSVDGESVDGKPIDGRAVDGGSTDGRAVDGKGVDIRQTGKTTRSRTTTEVVAEESCSGQDGQLRYPAVLSGALQEASSECLEACPSPLRQAVLDEVAGLAQRSRIRGSPVGLLRALVASARRGTFVAAAGLEVGKARVQTPVDRARPQPPEPVKRMSEAERAEVKRKLAALRTNLVASSATRRTQ